jgi:regulator of protease activity HflC (stomatin/prohibitin superfamily)
MDRILSFVCAVLVAVCVISLYVFWSASWPTWLLLVVWTIGLGFWVHSGLKKIEVGWKGQLLYLGKRMPHELSEGWRWVPFPFGIKTADCRQTILKLGQLEVITKAEDNVKVKIDGTIIRKIGNLNKYFGVEESGIKQGLDDIWDQTIRTNVREKTLDEVLGMHEELRNQVHDVMAKQASKNWGIKVLRVVIASIEPADSEVMKDLELKRREELQREGQKVELMHFIERVNELMASPPNGAGLSREQAVEQVQLALGKASKTIDAKTITLDKTTAEIVAAILGRR